MDRICVSAAEYTDINVAKAYYLLDRGGSLLLGDHKLEDSEIQGAAGFVRCSVNNMPKWVGGIIGAER